MLASDMDSSYIPVNVVSKRPPSREELTFRLPYAYCGCSKLASSSKNTTESSNVQNQGVDKTLIPDIGLKGGRAPTVLISIGSKIAENQYFNAI